MIILLYTILLLVSVYYLRTRYIRSESVLSNVLVYIIVFLSWFANVVDFVYIAAGYRFSFSAYIAVTFVYAQLLPFIFYYISDRFHLNIPSYTIVGLFVLTLFSFVPTGVVYLDSVPYEGEIGEMGIHVVKGGKIVAVTDMFSIIQLFQSVWIIIRLIILYFDLKRHNYHVVDRAKRLFLIFCLVNVVSLIETVISNNLFSKPYVYVPAMLTNLALLLWALYVLSNGLEVSFAVDSNAEPVYVEHKPKNRTIKEKFENIMARESLFCDPSLTVEQISARMQTNTASVLNMLREEFNISFASYVNMQRVEKAKELLREGKYSKLEDVGKAVGFLNAPTFTKTFKLFTGVTPKDWRKETLK